MDSEIDQLWDFRDPAASEKRFRMALESEASLHRRTELMTQIARALGLQRRFEDANAMVLLAESTTEPGTRQRVLCRLEAGRILNSSGKAQASIDPFVEVYQVARRIGEDQLAVDAAHMIAIVEPSSQKIEWNQTARRLTHKSTDPKARRWAASLLNNLGWVLHGLADFERAYEAFTRALALREERCEPEPIHVAKWCVARCLRSLGRIEQALEMQFRLLDQGKRRRIRTGRDCRELGLAGSRTRGASSFRRGLSPAFSGSMVCGQGARAAAAPKGSGECSRPDGKRRIRLPAAHW